MSAAFYRWREVRSDNTVREKTFTFDFDLTGHTAELRFRDVDGQEAEILFALGSGLSISGSTLTVAEWDAPAVSETTTYYFELKLTSPSGFKRTYVVGKLVVVAQ